MKRKYILLLFFVLTVFGTALSVQTIRSKPAPFQTLGKPVLTMNVPKSVYNGVLNISVGVKSDSKVENAKILVNGIETRGVASVENDGSDFVVSRRLTLQKGANVIRVEVSNADGTTVETRTVNYVAKDSPKPVVVKQSEKRLALVVGNSNYKYATQLANPKNDANDVANKLKELGFTVITREDVTLKDFHRAVSDFGIQAADYDVSLFYYAGHAIESDGENYLIPIDAQLERKVDLKSECVRAQDVLDNLEEAKSKANIIILDACRNNPISRGWSRAITRGLAQMSAPSGTYIMFATNPGNTADDGAGRNSPFTHAFLSCLEIPNLPLETFGKRVAQMVRKTTNNRQQPWRASSFDGDFYFWQEDNGGGGQAEVVVVDTVPVVPVVVDPVPVVPENRTKDYGEVINKLLSNMIDVRGGTFKMGATSEQGRDATDDEKPVHTVTVSSFCMGKYEVTQREWKAVMGSNPSKFKGDNLPVENVSWNDCQEFIRKLNSLTGKSFRLPTEAEWEYAARGGNKSQGYKYSGSNKLDNVGWYYDNSGSTTHEVGTKSPNELGLYDMSGNVFEWCGDWYGGYSSSGQTDPMGPSSGSRRVNRGGSWNYNVGVCLVSFRNRSTPGDGYVDLGFRLVLENNTEDYGEVINNLISNMVNVEGGTFTMGATSEQGRDATDDEKPVHTVTVSSFCMGKYEVTQKEWKAVMGSNPSKFKGDNLPVENVSWNDCQDFIRKLNSLTGKSFRLPTEAEWEYAARGGNKSQGYKYSGSNKLDNVGWYYDNSGSTTHEVGTKLPNELGLYDMSGNVWEWCNDWKGDYSSDSQTDPTGPSSASYRVLRGGSWNYVSALSRVSNRFNFRTPGSHGDIGFRLVY